MGSIAVINFISRQKTQTRQGLKALLDYCSRNAKTTYNGIRLVTGINCVAQSAYNEMMNTKLRYKKADGRMYYHLLQSFHPDEQLTPEIAHEIALRFVEENFPGYEVLVATHVDRNHIHSHMVINESAPSKTKGMSAREYRAADKGQSWKLDLAMAIDEAMCYAVSREHFIQLMELEGYQVKWSDTRKYITYTCPNGMKCRDNKLHEEKYLKEAMTNEFRIRKEITGRIESSGENEFKEQLDKLTSHTEETQQTLKEFQDTLQKQAQQIQTAVSTSMESFQSQVGNTSEEFSKKLYSAEEQTKSSLKKIIVASLIPTILLIIWELIRHIWLLT